jgi:ATP-dependent Clp protease ATP-binding subunit ClpC
MDYEEMKGRIMNELKKVFRPEFLNRIDDILVFHQLNKDQVEQILHETELTKLRARPSVDFNIELSPEVVKYILEHGWDPSMGARPLKRVIQRIVEDSLADARLSGKLTPGCTATIVGVDESGTTPIGVVEVTPPSAPEQTKPSPTLKGPVAQEPLAA